MTVQRVVWEKGRFEAILSSLVTAVVSLEEAHNRSTVKGLSGSSSEFLHRKIGRVIETLISWCLLGGLGLTARLNSLGCAYLPFPK